MPPTVVCGITPTTTLAHYMRPLSVLARTFHTLARGPRQPLAAPAVGLQFRARSQAAIDAAKPPPPAPEPTEDQLSADFFDETEVGTEEAVEWEGEEIKDGVFVSLPTAPSNSAGSGKSESNGRPRKTHSIKHLNRLLSRHRSPEIPETELEEKFVRGRGPGGQAINKTNSSVSLIHIPTGIRVQAQPTRSRAQNRVVARQILKERLDLMRVRGELEGVDSVLAGPGDGVKGVAAVEGEVVAEEAPVKVTRKEKLAAEARTWSKAELRWEKERRRKANRVKKVKRRSKGEDEGEEADE